MTLPMQLLGGTVLALMAAACGYFGVWVWRTGAKFRTKDSRFTVGRVVDVVMTSDNLGMKWSPKVEFETLEGQTIVFVGNPAEDNLRLKGRSVKVVYLPENPAEAEIQSRGPWVVLVLVFIFTAALLFASVSTYLGLTK
jgi:hypothetical protein